MPSWPPTITSRPAVEFTSSALAEIMTAGFEGYIVPQAFNAQTFDSRFRRESLDMIASRVIEECGRPIGLILVARRGWTARIAAIAFAQSHRNRGLGRIAMAEAIAYLTELGDRRLTLEVIETNEPALRLYEGLGFAIQRRLVGFRRRCLEQKRESLPDLVEHDPQFIARRLADEGLIDLPWQLAPETLACMSAPARGLALNGSAFAIIEPVHQAECVALRTLYVSRGMRRRGLGNALVEAVSAAYTGCDLVISACLPEELASAFFTRAGFSRTDISQWEMVKRLAE